MSDKKSAIEAWSDCMGDLRELGKNERNDYHKFMFRGIDAVMNATGPIFRKHKVVVIPTAEEIITDTAPTNKGGLAQIVRVRNKYTIYGPDGSFIEGSAWGEANDSADKATAKANSVAYRTFLLQSLTLPTHDTDPDAEGENLQQKPGWAMEIDSQASAEAVEGLLHRWEQMNDVPENVKSYARKRIADLRKRK